MESESGRATVLLARVRQGDRAAEAELVPLLYQELRAVAGRCMAGQPVGHTLQPTALVNEAWLRLFGGSGEHGWKDREHFVRVAARAMRCALVDHARAKLTAKRGAGAVSEPLGAVELEHLDRAEDVVAVGDALEELAARDEELARVAELRYFAGLGFAEVGAMLGFSEQAAQRRWRVARMALVRLMGE